MKTFYIVEINANYITLYFPMTKACSCGKSYDRWTNCDSSSDGYWFTCPNCKSTMITRK